jgi:Tol biopolymer transport system component
MSPDQKSAAGTRWVDGNGDIWIIDLERDTPTRLTFDDAVDLAPAWSPDGRTVYFTTQRGAAMHLYRKPADGSAEAEQLQETEHDQWVADVSRDGRLLLYAEDHAKTKGDLWVLPLDGDGEPEPFLVTRFAEYNARFSPDGNWIAYESDESGQRELYVRPYPGPGGKWQVSAAGGRYPRWSPDGRKLFFIEEDEVYEVSIASEGQALRAGRPEVVASLDPALRDRRHWSLAPDTNRFLFIQDPASASPEMAGENHALVRFTFHWFEELERLLDGTR